jgi:hypothetical protein
MKVEVVGHVARIELTRRNLTTLLAKLDDPASERTLVKDDDGSTAWVIAVEDDAHYSDRAPGMVYMPTSGDVL